MKKIVFCLCTLMLFSSLTGNSKTPEYRIYFGNTHAHSNYSGDIVKSRAAKGLELDPKNTVEMHYKLAKENGYDFYCVTDHSQYEVYTPEAFADVKAQADKSTSNNFVAIRGYEHSENDGPDGTGHMNVYNTDSYLSALDDGVSLEYFQNWLAKPENRKAIVSFNHPSPESYNTFMCYNQAAKDNISMFEIINGKNDKYPAFLVALSKGWKVSPVAGCDNHGIEGIAKWEARTGVATTELTYNAILGAMKSGRTYATYDKNLNIIYYVNNKPMGSIVGDKRLKFEVKISDPDTSLESNKITKIEIVGEGDKVVESKTFSDYAVNWTVNMDAKDKYYYIKVYNASRQTPIAYAAPVWVE